MKKIKTAVIGCGNISSSYLEKLTGEFDFLDVAGCADLDEGKARFRAGEYGIEVLHPEELLLDPDIQLVVNLTTPQAHFPVCRDILEAGKHAYVEKPLCLNVREGKTLLDLAKKKGLRLGCAPDTFLGAGIQTCRKLIDEGAIGRPVGASAFMVGHGHESWHPDPEFYYKPGGGPLFDMGPYYLTALVVLIGPVSRVASMTSKAFETRTITSEPKKGTLISVETPTHYTGSLEFENGALGTMVMSFDVWGAELPCIEIYGTEGTLSVPDPNSFSGPVRLKRKREEWREIPLCEGYAEISRGLGAAEMAQAVLLRRPHRASGEMAFHVLEIMGAFQESSEKKKYIELESRCERPEAFNGELGGSG